MPSAVLCNHAATAVLSRCCFWHNLEVEQLFEGGIVVGE